MQNYKRMITVMGENYGIQQVNTNIGPILLVIVLTAVIMKIFHSVISELTSPVREIPSPPGHFFLGHLPAMLSRDPTELYEYWLNNFSRNGMTVINLIGRKRIMISNPEDIKKVLVSEDRKFIQPPFVVNARPALKAGIFGCDGKEHAWQWKLLNPCFTSISIKQFVGLFIEKSSLLVKLWMQKIMEQKESSCTIVVQNDLKKLLFDIISMAAFGYDINTLSGANNENGKYLEALMDGSFNWKLITINKFLGYFGCFLRMFGVEDLNKATKVVDKLISEMMVNKEKKLKSPIKGNNRPNFMPDVLELMINLTDEESGSKMSEKVLKSNVMTFMLAGRDTSTSCLTWTLYLLALHEDKQEKAREEVLNASPRNSDITVENIHGMPYVEYVLKESLRLYPPGAAVSRLTSEPVTLGGICIPKGYPIIIPVCYIHRSEEFWTAPLEFKPERFDVGVSLNKEKKDIGLHYLPFSMGPRGCIGYKFAMLQMRIILASLLKTFKFSISPNHPTVRGKLSLALQPVPSPEIQVELVQ